MRTSKPRNGKVMHTVCIMNFTTVQRDNYIIGMPCEGSLKEVFSSDNKAFGGKGIHNKGIIRTEKENGPAGNPCRAGVTLPPLSCIYLDFVPDGETNETL